MFITDYMILFNTAGFTLNYTHFLFSQYKSLKRGFIIVFGTSHRFAYEFACP